MDNYKFFVNPEFDSNFKSGLVEGKTIEEWFKSKTSEMTDSIDNKVDFATLSEQLLLDHKKDFLIWDDILKAAEMTFFANQVPLKGPSIDFCCGYGYWTSKILGKIDLGVDIFPDEGGYNRSIEGFVDKQFIDGAYRSVLQADVTSNLPLPDNFFNSTIAVCSLEHIEDSKSVLDTMARITNPDGRIYLSLQTNKYIEVFNKIFNPDYVKWVRDNFAIHIDRTWQDWEQLIEESGLEIESSRFILSQEETMIKALTYWENPFVPVLGKLGLDQAIREIPAFRKFYYDKVREWSMEDTSKDEASIACYVCKKSK
jgi:SAM-dependent methyltransferase